MWPKVVKLLLFSLVLCCCFTFSSQIKAGSCIQSQDKIPHDPNNVRNIVYLPNAKKKNIYQVVGLYIYFIPSVFCLLFIIQQKLHKIYAIKQLPNK